MPSTIIQHRTRHGSQRTKFRSDGTGGRSLIDLTVKGRVVTLNLVKMVLRFQTGRAAVQTLKALC